MVLASDKRKVASALSQAPGMAPHEVPFAWGPFFKLHWGFLGSVLVGEGRQWMHTALVHSRLCCAQPDMSRKDLGAPKRGQQKG